VVSPELPGALPDGDEEEDEGPPEGLTLDAAIERLLAVNLDLQALKQELPQAEADVLTAGLRTNPLLFADSQFIPYGANNASHRPIGPTQYDVMLTYPLDVSRKRRARVRVACAARRVIQAQYQDAVRRQVGNLYRAFVDLQAARQTYLSARKAVGEQEWLASQRRRLKANEDPHRLTVEFQKTQSALADAADALGDAREALALLLNIPPDQAAGLEIRGRLRLESTGPPPLDELIRIALRYRPDLAATRLGINRADAEIRLAEANRLDDVFLFYDPLSYQDNRPVHLPSGRSWDVGLTIPLPIYNRNQGNIARARTNAGQSRLELAALERRVVAEVRLAEREYRSSRESLERFERTILPSARASRERTVSQFLAGTIDVDEYLGQLDEAQETAHLYREAVVRQRRSMLDLNVAVGVRLMP
jgi:cobalt-zinc-cadmium efflux system outer membrane protein